MMMTKKKSISAQSGFVTADFLFSFLLASMLTTFLFAMCFSFTVIEIAQYISFSSTRAALPAHKTPEDQQRRAQAKVDALLAHPELVPLLTNGWFELKLKDMRLGRNPSDFYDQYESAQRNEVGGFYIPSAGVRLNLTAKILNLNLGPLGKLESESGNGFNLTLGSMMFREPSQDECMQLIRERYRKIVNPSDSSGAVYSTIATPTMDSYVPMEDNGC